MKLLALLAAVAFTAGLASAQAIRAGTFHKQSIVVAFYRSPQWEDAIKAKSAESDGRQEIQRCRKSAETRELGQDQSGLGIPPTHRRSPNHQHPGDPVARTSRDRPPRCREASRPGHSLC
jgi:hypothetical protein